MSHPFTPTGSPARSDNPATGRGPHPCTAATGRSPPCTTVTGQPATSSSSGAIDQSPLSPLACRRVRETWQAKGALSRGGVGRPSEKSPAWSANTITSASHESQGAAAYRPKRDPHQDFYVAHCDSRDRTPLSLSLSTLAGHKYEGGDESEEENPGLAVDNR